MGLGASATAGGIGISAALIERAVKSTQTERIDTLLKERELMVDEAKVIIPDLCKMLFLDKITKDTSLKASITRAKNKFTEVMKSPSGAALAGVAATGATEIFQNPWVEDAMRSKKAYGAFIKSQAAWAMMNEELGGINDMAAAEKVINEAADSLMVEAGGDAVDGGGGSLEAGGSAVEASGSAVEAGGSAVEAGGSAVEVGVSAVEAGESTVVVGESLLGEAGGSAVDAGSMAETAGIITEAAGSVMEFVPFARRCCVWRLQPGLHRQRHSPGEKSRCSRASQKNSK